MQCFCKLHIIWLAFTLIASFPEETQAEPMWLPAAEREFTQTDFDKSAIDLEEIMAAGPPRDGIPPIDSPVFETVSAALQRLEPQAPVISVTVSGDARAYPLRVMIWHEIVNDMVGGKPVAVTYCPLCNTGIVFDRLHRGQTLDFGTTGRLRKSDLVMYDRQTETWWQQFNGRGLIGEFRDDNLRMLPSRLESLAAFAKRAPDGKVLTDSTGHQRRYGQNPYVGYDSSPQPFLYFGKKLKGVPPLMRVVRVDDTAWTLDLLRSEETIRKDDLRLSWTSGQSSALDRPVIADGLDVGNVIVERLTDTGWQDAVYSVDFVFAFHAFFPEGVIYGLP